MGIFDKLKQSVPGNNAADPSQHVAFPPPPQIQPLGARDVIKYRQQHGVNLGSWFVLERWITPTPFAGAATPGQSDLDVAKGSEAKRRLEEHWSSWITDDDWKWIKEHGYNSVRLPVSRI
jgi:aryl-phospho-beta-D-glucosidase BglC (GH1 family)